MKILKSAPLLLFAVLFIFAGCSANTETPNTAPPSTTGSSQPTTPSVPSQENASVTDQISEPHSGQNSEEISYITAADAEAAALSHAGVTADDVQNLRSEFDYDNGNAEYDVDFNYNGYEYDYDINAVTGEVTWHDKESENNTNIQNQSDKNAAANKSRLTAAEAETIALKHAGYSTDKVKGLHSKYDRDNGVYEYDIEFKAGGYEFDYEINADTGSIISFDKEWDD